MTPTPARVANRLVAAIKRFHDVLETAKSRDVNESDTVIIVTDMLSEIFGYDKYSEITSQHEIRGTYCDLATVLNDKVQLLVEAKAIGIELKDSHVKQAVDYAANKGVEWVVLTNGVHWKVFNVVFGKPIDQELVYEIDFLALDPKDDEQLSLVYVLTKEGWKKDALDDVHQEKQVLSKFVIAAIVASEPILDAIRRELRRMNPDVKISNDQIEQVMLQEVLKREVAQGETADEIRKKVSRAVNRQARIRMTKVPFAGIEAPAATIASPAASQTGPEA